MTEHKNVTLRTNKKTRCFLSVTSIEVDPFVEDQDNEISKDSKQEDQLWDKLTEDIQWIAEIPERKNCEKFHLPLNTTSNNYIVACHLPYGSKLWRREDISGDL